MKITENIKNKETNFCDIDVGVVFKYENAYLMRTMQIEDTTEVFNAVHLETGDYYYFQPYDKVEALDAILIIK